MVSSAVVITIPLKLEETEDCFETDTAEEEDCSRAWAQGWMSYVAL